MIKNRLFRCALILILCISFTGCAALQRKFARRKKEKEKAAPVVTTYDYAKELRVGELYKKHFLFWKTSQSELIDRIDSGYKKRSGLYDRVVANLMDMEGYLTAPKRDELRPFKTEITSIEPEIKKKRLSENSKYKIRQLLERTKREIEKHFSYSDVEGSLGLKK